MRFNLNIKQNRNKPLIVFEYSMRLREYMHYAFDYVRSQWIIIHKMEYTTNTPFKEITATYDK